MSFEFMRRNAFFIKVKMRFFQKIIHFWTVFIRSFLMLILLRDSSQKRLFHLFNFGFRDKVVLREQTNGGSATTEWTSSSVKTLALLIHWKVMAVFLLLKRLNLDTANNWFNFHYLRIWRFWLWHSFFIIFFIIVQEKFFALFVLREVFAFLKISLWKYDQVVLFVHDFWALKMAISYWKWIWNLHDLSYDAVW